MVCEVILAFLFFWEMKAVSNVSTETLLLLLVAVSSGVTVATYSSNNKQQQQHILETLCVCRGKSLLTLLVSDCADFVV